MLNAGKYKHRIEIFKVAKSEDGEGFKKTETEKTVLSLKAAIKTTKGFTLITSGTDFEKAYTNFTVRFPQTPVTRDMLVRYNGKIYTIEYLNNVDEMGIELEIQAKEITK